MKFSLILVFLFIAISTFATVIEGVVIDKTSNEAIIGATITLKGRSTVGAVTDINGKFAIKAVAVPATLVCSYVGYDTREVTVSVNDSSRIIKLSPKEVQIKEVVVKARRKPTNEGEMLAALKNSYAVSSGVSASQISRSSDRDASEVVQRIPGISIFDERFIVVRGLPQRYNNVWINGGSVPSTEADGRAFSFDLIPSALIEGLVVTKSPTADLPSDFAGGFVKITTKSMPPSNFYKLSVTSGFNTVTHFQKAAKGYSNSADFVGLGTASRDLSSNFPSHLGLVTDANTITSITKSGFGNNDWNVQRFSPLPDIRLNYSMGNRFELKGGQEVGVVTALGYTNVVRTLKDIENRRFGIYSSVADQPVVEKDYLDQQYTNDVRVNAMNNWTLKINNHHQIDFRNMFNLMGRNRYTEREGFSFVSGNYYEKQTETYYSSRLSYTGQLAGNHNWGDGNRNVLDWSLGYSYANKNEPDRRIVLNRAGITDRESVTPNLATFNDKISRYFQYLNDYSTSFGADYTRRLGKNWESKSGLYGEYRSRDFTPREFTYRYDKLSTQERDQYIYLPVAEMMSDKWLGADKVYVDEVTQKSNAYSATNFLGAAYTSVKIPMGKLTVNAGLRYEYWQMGLTYDRAMAPTTKLITQKDYNDLDLLPSLNATYNITEKQLLRFAYGRSVNRPEFRELSPSVFYDFDLFAEVEGNPELKTATIDNIDFRYEYYPSKAELISGGVFYKHFVNPIEWNFVDMGGSYRYSYENATSASSYGIEIDLRKSLNFMQLPNLTFVANGAYIFSQVTFDKNKIMKQKDRPMQGQSPYTINAGFYYNAEKSGWSGSLLYNTVGKRIVGIGKANSLNGNSDTDLPDSYEMPRHLVDITIGKKLGKVVEFKFGVKDLLASEVLFKQFPTATINGAQVKREQIIKRFTPGTTINLTVTFNL